jgi:formate/nitrite transporter FocA (FNT family)
VVAQILNPFTKKTATEKPSKEKAARLSAHEIFDQVAKNARDELSRSTCALFISGLAGGVTMGLTGLSVAIVVCYLGYSPRAELLSLLAYPIGFIAVIIGRKQLFTENTLYPVALILAERKSQHVLNSFRLWTAVFVGNVLGVIGFGLLASRTDALRPEYKAALVQLGIHAVQPTHGHIFWSGIVGGWLIALVAWIVTASRHTIGQIAVVWLFTFMVGLGHFAHCIASSGEILTAVFAGSVQWPAYPLWLALATAGNIIGGIVFVTLLNYGQVAGWSE